jgi:hypothetical protein
MEWEHRHLFQRVTVPTQILSRHLFGNGKGPGVVGIPRAGVANTLAKEMTGCRLSTGPTPAGTKGCFPCGGTETIARPSPAPPLLGQGFPLLFGNGDGQGEEKNAFPVRVVRRHHTGMQHRGAESFGHGGDPDTVLVAQEPDDHRGGCVGEAGKRKGGPGNPGR